LRYGRVTVKKEKPESYLPMTEAAFHVLLALADGEKHGYAIKKEVSRRTSDKVRLGPGTLYGIIKRLLLDGLVIESDERPDPALDDERRRYYRLTRLGEQVAIAEANRMQDLIDTARAKKLLGRPRTA
jgi:DNA-binding PadR family transcriptional regulator